VKPSAATIPPMRVALYEGAGSHELPAAERGELLRTLLEKGFAVSCIRPGGQVAPPPGGALVVLGRFTEAKPREAEDHDGKVTLHFRDIAGLGAAQVAGLIEEIRGQVQGPTPAKSWKPWFPVIDYGRCTNCMQCLSFCLFDVYGAPGGKISVQNPVNCKTDCPACSRVCPEVAILFPKYKAGPINGDEVKTEDVHREKMKVDISALLGGDIYAALRQRSAGAKERFAKERDEKRALQERKMCLTKLQQQFKELGEALDIPPELLNALPSADMIRAKAAAAAGAGE
jgi:NAD-dependent dihydropyrimidine dehydrogenase PreA subunit